MIIAHTDHRVLSHHSHIAPPAHDIKDILNNLAASYSDI